MLKSLLIAAVAATTLAIAAGGTASAAPISVAALADAKPASELVQVGFKKKHFGVHIHVGGFGPGYGHGYYDGYGYGCRHLYRRWKFTGSYIWHKRYMRCIGAW